MKPLSLLERLVVSSAKCLLIAVIACAALPKMSEAGVDLIAVTITSTEADPTVANPIPVTFTFDEGVTGFEQGDITPTNGSLSNFSSQSTTVYSVDVEPLAEGSVEVSIAVGAAQAISDGDDSEADMFAIQFNAVRRPDLRIGKSNAPATHDGNDVYAGLAHVQKRLKKKTQFHASFENDGNLPDRFVSNLASSSKFKAKFRDLTAGGSNVTAALRAGTYSANYRVGGVRLIEANISPKKTKKKQKFRSVTSVTSANAPVSDTGSVLLKFLGEKRKAGSGGGSQTNDAIGGNVIP